VTTQKINYAASAAITISLASLATSSTFVAGQESNQIDNSSNLYDDALVSGKITVGTTPTTNTQILVYVWGADTDITGANLDVLDGADSAETLTSAGVRNGLLKLGASLDVDSNTSNRVYYIGAFSVAQLFGGVMPKFWGLFVTHNTGVNLNSTGGNHALAYQGIKYDFA
jgi:hypothetical protein